jgi:hypothetical protein
MRSVTAIIASKSFTEDTMSLNGKIESISVGLMIFVLNLQYLCFMINTHSPNHELFLDTLTSICIPLILFSHLSSLFIISKLQFSNYLFLFYISPHLFL